MDAEKLRAIRMMYAAFMRGLEEADPEDVVALDALDVLAGALVGYVPELLDEIVRLTRAAEPPPRVVKFDGRGGNA